MTIALEGKAAARGHTSWSQAFDNVAALASGLNIARLQPVVLEEVMRYNLTVRSNERTRARKAQQRRARGVPELRATPITELRPPPQGAQPAIYELEELQRLRQQLDSDDAPITEHELGAQAPTGLPAERSPIGLPAIDHLTNIARAADTEAYSHFTPQQLSVIDQQIANEVARLRELESETPVSGSDATDGAGPGEAPDDGASGGAV